MAPSPRQPFRPSGRKPASAAAVRRDGDEIRPSGPRPVVQPLVPEDVEIRLPRGLRRAIDEQVRDGERSRTVQRALTLGGNLIDEGRGEEAIELLAWAKSHAARVADVREALGIAHYQAGDYRTALNELRTFRRMAASQGQNHVIADCLRGLEHPVAEVATEVQAMLGADGVHADRQVEGLLVWAGALRDAGDLRGARAVLRRADDQLLQAAIEEARQRFQWFAADLAEAAGDIEAARTSFAALAALPEDPWGAIPRLAALGS